VLEIAICDDNGNDLNAIMEMLHEICTEMKQEYHVSAFQSPNDMLDRQKKIDIGIIMGQLSRQKIKPFIMN
jgi:uncharacterized protein YlxP (DUF503 family)